MKKGIYFMTFLLGYTIISSAQLPVGKKTPEPSLELILQAPVSKLNSWSAFEDKWVFMEFWATWCAPCIAKMPELNALQKEMINDNIQFISISPEKPDKVTRFLERKSISGWVGVDTDNSFINNMKVSKYPTTILISPDRKVHSIIGQNELKKDSLLLTIREAIKKNSLEKKPKGLMSMGGGGKTSKDSNSNEPQDYYVKLEKSDLPGGFVMRSRGKLESNSISMSELVAIAYGTSKFYILGTPNVLKSRHSVNAVLPNDNELFQQMLQSEISKQLKIKVTKERKEVNAYNMIAPNGISKNLYITDADTKRKVSFADGVIAIYSDNLDRFFIPQLENILNVKITNKTNLSSKFDFNLYWDKNNPQSIINALEEQLGLVLESTKSIVDVFVVESFN